MANLHQQTIAVHGGYSPKNGEPRVMPIVQSTTFKYESSDQMANLFALTEAGYFYTRLANPTVDTEAARIVELEGGVAGFCTSSGQAASFYSIFNIASAGDHIISSSNIYGGTYNLFAATFKRMGIDFTFVNPAASLEDLAKEIRPNTKAVFGETLANPALSVLDIEKFAKLAHDAGLPLIVDNTFPTPYLCQPIKHGADIVIHSTTKYLDGHGTSVGGVVVDSGNFDWAAHADKFPGLTTPDPTYNNIIYTDTFGSAAYALKGIVQLLRDLGSSQSPFNAYLTLNGMTTLGLRMERHSSNALAVAEFLEAHPKVKAVNYPGLSSSHCHDLAHKYLPKGCSGVLTFEIDSDAAGPSKLQDALKVIAIATHVADAKSCILHPARTTHAQLSPDALAEAGVSPTQLRLSVGIEDVRDLIADLEQALSHI